MSQRESPRRATGAISEAEDATKTILSDRSDVVAQLRRRRAESPDCWLCERRPRARGWSWCTRCLRDLVDGLRRRREASYRMVPLEDGRRDPLEAEGVAS